VLVPIHAQCVDVLVIVVTHMVIVTVIDLFSGTGSAWSWYMLQLYL